MTKEEKVRIVGGKFLRYLGLSQGPFILGLISSPFVWIFGTGLLAFKIFLASIVGIIVINGLYQGIRNRILDEIDTMDDLFNQK